MMQSVPHQVVQSPARLGLPTPNSPSLSNPTTPKLPPSQSQQAHNPLQQSNVSTTSFTSSTLLPLLPPLPRAQSILIQMASLASRLFEVSPNRSQWISAFRGSLPSFLSSQTQSVTSYSADSSPSPKEIISLFSTLQTQLFAAVAELQEILDLQDSKQKISREIRAKDASLLAFANKLKETERVLDMLVDDYSYCRRQKRSKSEEDSSESSTTTIATHLKLSDILSYAHKISYTTFAPPEFGAGQAPLRGALPPAPQDEQMRASQLYNFADLDVGLPKADAGKEKAIEPLIEEPAAQPDKLPIPDPILPHFVIPSWWKPGMPLPKAPPGLKPPPGWKPGDPIPPTGGKPGDPILPAGGKPGDPIPPPGGKPGDPIPPQVSPKIKEEGPRSMPPPSLLKVPVSIQVRRVELDFDKVDSSDSSSDASYDSED